MVDITFPSYVMKKVRAQPGLCLVSVVELGSAPLAALFPLILFLVFVVDVVAGAGVLPHRIVRIPLLLARLLLEIRLASIFFAIVCHGPLLNANAPGIGALRIRFVGLVARSQRSSWKTNTAYTNADPAFGVSP
jgi:hypothetical protein